VPHPEPAYVPAVGLPLQGVVSISADVQLGIRAIETPGQSAEVCLHLCLERRIVRGTDATSFCPTSAGFRVPLHLCGLLADEIRVVATRAAERALWAPPVEKHSGG
jgi:hypothetical protein